MRAHGIKATSWMIPDFGTDFLMLQTFLSLQRCWKRREPANEVFPFTLILELSLTEIGHLYTSRLRMVDFGKLLIPHTAGNRILEKVALSSDFPEFADSLRSIDSASSGWQWIEVVIGSVFSMSLDEPSELDDCVKMLAPFKRWMTVR